MTTGTGGNAGTAGAATGGTTARGGASGMAGAAAAGGDTARGGTGGTAAAGGAGGDVSTTGLGGAGVAGGGGGDLGAAGNGVAGDAGTGGTTGDAGATGAAGTTGAAGSGGRGVAGVGGTSAAGTGGGGAGGRGGGGGGQNGCGPATCPNGCCRNNQCLTAVSDANCGTNGVQCAACTSCFRCGTARSCEPNPTAIWNVICASAVIAPTKPNGSTWDTAISVSSGPNPDPFCRLTTSDGRSRSSPVLTDTLTPAWNANVSPTSGGGLMSRTLSTAGSWTLSVYDQDSTGIGSGMELICAVTPAVTTAQFTSGTLGFSNVGSCNELTLNLTCGQ
jgi:hypothetical protein